MKSFKHLLTLFLTLSCLASLLGQNTKKTLNYQAVILDPKAIDIPGASITGQPLNKGNVCLRFSLLNAQGGLDYEEIQQVTTDEYGLVNVAIGAGTQAQTGNSISIYKSFDSVVWTSSIKSLKVSVSYDGCSSFKQVSSQAFNYTPYALYAESVDYKNVRDSPTKLSQFTNDPGYIILKDLDPLKADILSNTSQLATANQTIADNKKISDAAFLIVNQSITSLGTKVAENTTALKETSSSIGTINTKLSDQQNQIVDNRNQITATNNNLNTQIGGLQGQINNTNNTVNNLTGVAEMQSNKSTATNLGGANPSDQAYPSQKAAKSYIDNAIYDAVGTGVPDATTLAAGKVKLAGDLGGTAASPTVPALAGKENSSNKTTAIDLGAGNPSDQLYPSQKATKSYVDNAIYQAVGSGVPDATTMAAGKLKLAGDLAGTAASPTVPGLLLKEDVSNKSTSTSLGNSNTAYPTQNAVKTYVDAQIANATIADANSSTKGKIQLAGALGGTADSPTVPGLLLKEDLSNKSTATDLGAGSTSDIMYPSQKAVKAYIDAQASSLVIPEATALVKGKLQLAGDLTGSASSPTIATGAINSAKILDQSIATVDIADAAITDVKISGISGGKVSGNIAGNAANVNGTVAVGNGGTGATNLSGYVIGNGTSAMTTVSKIPVADVTGAIKKVNGTLPNSSGEVTIFFGKVSTGIYDNRPTFSLTNQNNGDIYIVSGDVITSHNGRTFIRDDNAWNEVSPNMASTDARYLQLSGGNMGGDVTFPTGKKVILTDAPTGSTDAVNKAYVDNKISTEVPNATSTSTGKIQLTGDLAGTAISPTVPGLLLKAPINNPAFTGTVTGITSAMVGLGNVDNTTDANKPISTATQSSLDLKAPLASPTFTGTVSGITKAMIGLTNVDNTSDANKPISDATTSALNLKENASNKSDAAIGSSTTLFPTQNAVKTYVDAQVASGAPDANGSTKGKIKLAGDLSGTADLPVIATGAITSAKILDGEIVNADISTIAAIEDTKLASIVTSGKVSNSATTATNINTASAIVARDGSGNFSAGTITAALTGNASTATKLAAPKNINGVPFDGSSDITIYASSGTLSGTVAVGNGGTGATTLTGIIKGNGTNALTAATAGTDYQAPLTITQLGVLSNTSGTNTGDQTITLTGDVTGTGTGSFATTVNSVGGVSSSTIASLPTSVSANTSSITSNIADIATINTSLSNKANLNSPSFTGTPSLPTGTTGITQTTGDNSTKLATTAFVAASITASSAGLSSVGAISATSNEKGAIISNTTQLILTPADATNGGVVTTGTQIFAGTKTFNNDINVNSLITVGRGPQNNSTSTALGRGALASNSGSDNVALGYFTLSTATTNNNTAVGYQAKRFNSGNNNVAIGHQAIYTNSGSNNTVVGYESLNTVVASTGSNNVIVGDNTGNQYGTVPNSYITNLGQSVLLGSGVKPGVNSSTNEIAIGYNVVGNGSNTVTIGNYSNTANYFRGDINLTGNVNGGTWSGTTIGSNYGGAGTINGLLKANGSGLVSAAVAGTDYQAPLTTTQLGVLSNTSGTNTGDQTITLTGDVTGIGTGTFTTTLTNSGVIAGSYGSTTSIPTFTVDAKGRLTSAGTITSTAVPYTGATQAVNLGAYDLTVNGLTVGTGINGGAVSNTNTALGISALVGNNSGSGANTAIGSYVLKTNTTGSNNTGVGYYALQALTTATDNTALGAYALRAGSSGYFNTSIGSKSMFSATTGGGNTAVGVNALYGITTAGNNTAMGFLSLNNLTTGDKNIALGYKSGSGVTSGTSNIMIGANTGSFSMTTGSYNTIIGTDITGLPSTLSNNIILADGAGNIRAQHNGTTGWALGTIVSGTWSGTSIAIANGGTGATTASSAFDALSPMTASGDLIYGATNGSGTRLPKGTDGQVLTLASGVPAWLTAATSGGGISSIGAISATSDAKGATISGSTQLILSPADQNNGGIVTTQAQTFAGAKTFSSNIIGNLTGNASTATTLATSRNINGIAFNGSTDITIAADANTLTGTTLASNVVSSSLTSVGTITTGVWSGTAIANNKLANSTTTLGSTTMTLGGTVTSVTGLTSLTATTVVGTLSGTASTATNIAGGAIGAIPYQSAAGTTAILSGNTSSTVMYLTSSGNGTVSTAPSWATLNAIPYSGATSAVNLGLYDLTVNGLTVGRGGNGVSVSNVNTTFGINALSSSSTSGSGANTAIGNYVLSANTSGANNTGLGYNALGANVTGRDNTAVGYYALRANNSSSSDNTAIGSNAMYFNTSGTENTAVGSSSLYKNASGIQNSVLGRFAYFNGEGSYNTAVGYRALMSPNAAGNTGEFNVSMGYYSGSLITTGSQNLFLGSNAGYSISTGNKNIFIGYNAGSSISSGSTANTTGLNSVLIGYDVRPAADGETNQIVIAGYTGTGVGQIGLGTNSTLIGNTSTQQSRIYGALTVVPNTATGAGNSSTIAAQNGGTNLAGGGLIFRAGNGNGTGNGGDINLYPGTTGTGTAGKVIVNGGDMTVNSITVGLGKNNISTNTALGYQTLNAIPSSGGGGYNTAVGYQALLNNTSGSGNVALGNGTLAFNTTSSDNTAIGYNALNTLNNGASSSGNVAVGSTALGNGQYLTYNTAVGNGALYIANGISGTPSTNNTALGYNALNKNTTGNNNIGIGSKALFNLTTASNNTAIGVDAGSYNLSAVINTTGSNGVYLGYKALPFANGLSNEIVIGANSNGNGSNTTTIGNTSTQQSQIYGALTVVPNAAAASTNGASSTISAQSASTNLFNGGALNLNAGNGLTSGIGGDINLNAGDSYSGAGGNINLNAGNSAYTGTTSEIITNADLKLNGITAGRGKGNSTNNTIFGNAAFGSNTTGTNNAAFGTTSLYANTTGNLNTAIGSFALSSLRGTYHNNTAIGATAIQNMMAGGDNVALGYNAAGVAADGTSQVTYSIQGVFIGSNSKPGTSSSTNEIVIGYNAKGQGDNTTTIGNSSTNTTYIPGSLTMGISSGVKSGEITINPQNTQYEGGQINIIKSPALGSTGSNWTIDQFGSTVSDARIRIFPGTDETIGLLMKESGNIGMGVAPTNMPYKLNVAGDINAYGGVVRAAGTQLTSDLRLKNNILPLNNSMNVLNLLRPVSYDKKYNLSDSVYHKQEFGFIAQEVQKVLPQLVTEGKDKDKLLSMDYISIIPLLTKAMQEQDAVIKDAQKENTDLRAELEAQKIRLEKLERLIEKMNP